MTNISNNENEISTSVQNQAIEKFYLELENLKKSNPNKKIVLQQRVDNSSFFKSLLGIKIVEEKTVYTDVKIDGFISMKQFLNLLYDYFDFIYYKSEELIRKFRQKTRNFDDLIITLSHYAGMYFCIKKVSKYSEKILEVEFSEFPKLVNGKIEDYESIKEELFELLPYFKIYYNICNLFESKILIAGNSYISIVYESKNEIFKRKYPLVDFKFSNVAMIEISKKDGEDEKYLPYADDKELIEILKSNCEELFYSCYIPDDIELIKLLKSR